MQETRGFIPLRTLARDLLSLECHPGKVVTVTSLQAAFPQMKHEQAGYLMRTLFQEDKRQKATQQVLEGQDSGASQDFDPKEVANACLPAFHAATQPLLTELISTLTTFESKVATLQSNGLLDAATVDSLRTSFAKEMVTEMNGGKERPIERRFQGPRAHKIQAVDPLCVSAVSPKSQGHQLQLPLLVGFFRFLGFFGMVYYRIIHGNTCFFLNHRKWDDQ